MPASPRVNGFGFDYFLGAGLVVEDRRAHEQALLRDYWRALGAHGVEHSLDVVGGAGGEHYRLEQRVRREAVGAVSAGR